MLKKSFLIILLILVLDQIVKIWVKTTFTLGQEINVFGNWFILHFTENPGMAFGMELDFKYGKLLLTLFRIVAVVFLTWYLFYLNKKKANFGIMLCFSLILAGALGNIIDSVFYGVIFSESTYYQVATAFPPEGGYGTWFHGKVVDMLFFPIIDTTFPDWMPFLANKPFRFFQPVFNISDSAITIGVLYLILFQRSFFNQK